MSRTVSCMWKVRAFALTSNLGTHLAVPCRVLPALQVAGYLLASPNFTEKLANGVSPASYTVLNASKYSSDHSVILHR